MCSCFFFFFWNFWADMSFECLRKARRTEAESIKLGKKTGRCSWERRPLNGFCLPPLMRRLLCFPLVLHLLFALCSCNVGSRQKKIISSFQTQILCIHHKSRIFRKTSQNFCWDKKTTPIFFFIYSYNRFNKGVPFIC